MMVFRHKSSKGSFQLKAVIPVLLGLAALIGVVNWGTDTITGCGH